MIAIYERRIISQPEKIWAARYLNLQNIVHWHDECEIVFCEKKTCEIECNEEKIILSENETAFIRSRAIHKIKAEKGGILITLLIDSSLLKDIIDHYQLKNIKVNIGSFPKSSHAVAKKPVSLDNEKPIIWHSFMVNKALILS